MPRKKPEVPVKTISLMGDHVHMPTDLLTPGWETAQETARYDRRSDGKVAKYTVHEELADFLIGRDQAMEVVPDVYEGDDDES